MVPDLAAFFCPVCWTVVMFCVDSVVISTKFVSFMKKVTYTGKSFSEALILAPVNPQYDERLFIEFQEK